MSKLFRITFKKNKQVTFNIHKNVKFDDITKIELWMLADLFLVEHFSNSLVSQKENSRKFRQVCPV